MEKYCRTFVLHGATPLSRCTPTEVCIGEGFDQAPASHEREDMQTFLENQTAIKRTHEDCSEQPWCARSASEGKSIFGSFARTDPKAYLRH